MAQPVAVGPYAKTTVRPSLSGFPAFCGIAQHHHQVQAVSTNPGRVEKQRRNDGRMAIFQARGGKRVILVNGRSELAVALIERGFQLLPRRVI